MAEDYRRDVHDAERFLLGDTEEVINDLQAQMMSCAEALEFERRPRCATASARCRACCTSRAWTPAACSATDKDVDILAVRVAGGRACVNLAMVRGSRHLGDRAHFPTHVDDGAAMSAEEADGRADAASPEVAVLEAFIVQHYVGQAVPSQLVLSHAVDSDSLPSTPARAATTATSSATPSARSTRPRPAASSSSCSVSSP